MNVLVIGKGGREHAIVRALSFSQSVNEVHCAPGSDGMKKDSFVHDINVSNLDELQNFLKQKRINLVIIGPENFLVDGLADHIRSFGVDVFGPSKVGARLEASKVFAKQFMQEAGVPTSQFTAVSSVQQTIDAAAKFKAPFVFKADGLAAGKGVAICSTLKELKSVAEKCFEDKVFGDSGKLALLEEFQNGYELSFLILTNGKEYQAMPLAQDHKSLYDGGKGPNTGGMGVVAPIKIDVNLEKEIHEKILKPTVDHINKSGVEYHGVVFVGLMVTKDGPTVIEYNVRFGDPETQTLLPLLDGDWGEVFSDIAKGVVKPLSWKSQCVSCIVLAAENYPAQPVKGVKINGNIQASSAFSYILHAGTKKNEDGDWVTNGGRVINLIGMGSTHGESVGNAYKLCEEINWDGMQLRRDIGAGISKI